MGQVGHVAEALSPDMDRRYQRHVVQVDAAGIGVVGQDGVALSQLFNAVFPDSPGHQFHQRTQMDRLPEGLSYGPQLVVEVGAGEVGPGLDVGGIGAAPERNRHFLGGFHQGVADHFELNRVHSSGHP